MADRRVSVRVDADVSPFVRSLGTAAASAKAFASQLESADSRMGNLVQTGLALAPALVPIGATAVPAIAGLATQLGAATAGVGVLALAFSGIGDSLKAVNEYAIDPTTANFEKMNEELANIGPAGRDFVMYLQELRPELQRLQDVAQEGLLPGAQEGIEELMTRLPMVERIVGQVADALGGLMADAGASLAGPQWREFFEFVERTAAPMLTEMAQTLGNFITGMANMMVAFEPLSRQFSAGFLQMSRDFEAWSDGLADS